MKLTTILLLAAVTHVAAKSSAQTVTYTGKSVPVQTLFSIIEKQTGYVFFYEQADLKNTRPVSVVFDRSPLKIALEKIVADQPIEFELKGHTIFIYRKKIIAHVEEGAPVEDTAQVIAQDEVKGIVMDETRRPVPGVTILAKIARELHVSDEKGVFVFTHVQAGDTLVFTSVNYDTRSIAVEPGKLMSVTLKLRIARLDQVTIFNTGYQVLSKERATGSFSKPDMDVFQKRTGTQDIIDRLDGQIPGLVVTKGDNAVNANANGNGVTTQKSVIRGVGTISLGTDPLYVVNGVIVTDFSSVNPDDVADITVLKDAAASAIYGARAANGVIVLTTRTGARQSRPVVSYSGYFNFQGRPDFNAVPVLSSRQYIQAAKETFDPVAYPYSSLYSSYIAPHEQIQYDAYRGLISQATADQRLDSLASINNLSQIKSLWYRPAFTNNHTVSVSGGNSLYSFYASLGYTGSHSNLPGDRNDAYKINVTQHVNLGSRVSFSLNTMLVNNVTSSKNPLTISNRWLPYQLFIDPSTGKQINLAYMTNYSDSLRQIYQARSGINLDYYPLQEMDYIRSSSNLVNINVTGNLGIRLWKGLSFSGTYGYVKSPGTSTYFTDNRQLYQRLNLLSFTVAPSTPGGTPTYYLPVTGGNYTTGTNDQRNYTVRNQLVYEARPRAGKDYLSLQAGQEVNESYNFRNSSTLYGYDPALGTYALLDFNRLQQGVFGTVTGAGFFYSQPYYISTSLSRFRSYFGLASYTYAQRYSLDASAREDHSNLFGSDISSQNKPAWSAGLKWQIGKEDFMSRVKWVNSLALRATYGITGNSPYVGAASQQDILNAVSSSNSYGVISGNAFRVGSTANNKLSWETTRNINIGIDYSLLKGDISGGFDYYSRVTTGLLASMPVNPLTGYASITGNLGEITNKGFELSIRTNNIRLRNGFSWTTSFNISYNRNILVSYGRPNPYVNQQTYNIYSSSELGRPLNLLLAYKFAGLDNMGDPQILLHDKTITKDPYAAQPQDLVYKGTTVPPFSGGLSNTFRYKGLSLVVNMIYRLGGVMRTPTNQFYYGRLSDYGSFRQGNVDGSFVNRWKKPGDEKITNIPSWVPDANTNYSRRNTDYYSLSDINVARASYLKIRDLTLGYDLQPRWLRAIGAQSINLFAQATNFLVWKANHFGDPEYIEAGSGTPAIPPYRHSYSFGCNLSL